jgi:CO/xanthine dehydrogenase Mo-binding subunit/aerobic-type carbon monoxide dehydrogenase small subunit (CoxS/CutS family)
MNTSRPVSLNINGEMHELLIAPGRRLIEVLREDLHLTGTKNGCNQGVCGACTVLLEGKPIRSCLSLAIGLAGRSVTTIEGLADGEQLSPVQQAFLDAGAIQCGFCMPGLIVTASEFIERNPTPSDDEIRHAISGNLCRCSGYVKVIEAIKLAAARRRAANANAAPPVHGASTGMEPGDDVNRAVGRTLSRLEARGKATGQATFTDDLSFPRMLHGSILGSPHSHARIISYDVSKALAYPGVKAVVTGKDVAALYMGPLIKDEMALAVGKVRYMGEPVAAVAAVDPATARAAVRLIDIEYEELPAVFTPAEAIADGAPLLHEKFKDYVKVFELVSEGNTMSSTELAVGNVERGFAESDHIIEHTYETQAQYHAYLEPVAAIADVDAEGKVTVWSSTQSVFRTQANIAECLGIPHSKIRALSPRVGGAFGAKSEATVQQVAVMLSQRSRRPVKIVLDRSEDMLTMRSRHPAKIRIKTGFKNDGTFVAQEFDLIMDGGAYADDSPTVMMLAVYFSVGPYRVPHAKTTGRVVYTNKLRAGAFRGYGNPQASFARESQIDAIAEFLGMDPIELRLKNVMQDGDRWIDGKVVDKISVRECLERARAESRWHERRSASEKKPYRGIGVAVVAHVCGHLTTSAVLRVLEDGTVSVNTSATDIGQGSDTVIAQMTAGALGLPVDKVNVVIPDTDASPYNSGTQASRVTYMVGRAIGEAADDVKRKLFKHAAEIFECDAADIELLPGGRVAIVGANEKALSFRDISMRAHWQRGGPIIGSGSFVYEDVSMDPSHVRAKGFMPVSFFGTFIFGAQIVTVAVEEATGKAEVLEVWSCHDVGKAINPGAVQGQIEGGVVQGLGYALFEEMVWDGGRLVNPSFMDYKIPGSLDVPHKIHSIIIENAEPSHPFGAKGVGEPPIIGIAAAVANAVQDAAYVRIRSLPITPERVLRAMTSRDPS